MHYTCSCPCGETGFSFTGTPLARFNCHCTLCQGVYKAPFADAFLMQVDEPFQITKGEAKVVRKKANGGIDRAVCSKCETPLYARFPQSFMGKLAFVSAGRLPAGTNLPPVDRHIFYGTRVADVADGLPKYDSALMSNLSLTLPMIKGLLGRG